MLRGFVLKNEGVISLGDGCLRSFLLAVICSALSVAEAKLSTKEWTSEKGLAHRIVENMDEDGNVNHQIILVDSPGGKTSDIRLEYHDNSGNGHVDEAIIRKDGVELRYATPDHQGHYQKLYLLREVHGVKQKLTYSYDSKEKIYKFVGKESQPYTETPFVHKRTPKGLLRLGHINACHQSGNLQDMRELQVTFRKIWIKKSLDLLMDKSCQGFSNEHREQMVEGGVKAVTAVESVGVSCLQKMKLNKMVTQVKADILNLKAPKIACKRDTSEPSFIDGKNQMNIPESVLSSGDGEYVQDVFIDGFLRKTLGESTDVVIGCCFDEDEDSCKDLLKDKKINTKIAVLGANGKTNEVGASVFNAASVVESGLPPPLDQASPGHRGQLRNKFPLPVSTAEGRLNVSAQLERVNPLIGRASGVLRAAFLPQAVAKGEGVERSLPASNFAPPQWTVIKGRVPEGSGEVEENFKETSKETPKETQPPPPPQGDSERFLEKKPLVEFGEGVKGKRHEQTDVTQGRKIKGSRSTNQGRVLVLPGKTVSDGSSENGPKIFYSPKGKDKGGVNVNVNVKTQGAKKPNLQDDDGSGRGSYSSSLSTGLMIYNIENNPRRIIQSLRAKREGIAERLKNQGIRIDHLGVTYGCSEKCKKHYSYRKGKMDKL